MKFCKNIFLRNIFSINFDLESTGQKCSLLQKPLNLDFNFFFLFRAASAAYRHSQAGGLIGATDASLHHSQSNARSLTHWTRPGIEHATSQFLVRFISTVAQWELLDFNLYKKLKEGEHINEDSQDLPALKEKKILQLKKLREYIYLFQDLRASTQNFNSVLRENT